MAMKFKDSDSTIKQLANITTDITSTEADEALAASVLNPWMGDRQVKMYTSLSQFTEKTSFVDMQELVETVPEGSFCMLFTSMSTLGNLTPTGQEYGTLIVYKLVNARTLLEYQASNGDHLSSRWTGEVRIIDSTRLWTGWKEVTTYNADGSITLGDTSISEEWMDDRNLKTYTSLSQIGLYKSTATMVDILTTLPHYSSLQCDLSSIPSGVDDVPANPSMFTVSIFKEHNARMTIKGVYKQPTTEYVGVYGSTDNVIHWYGWKQVATLDDDALESTTTVLSASKVNDLIGVWHSDQKFKRYVKDQAIEALPLLNSVKVRKFEWNKASGHEGEKVAWGVISQELQEVEPTLVRSIGEDLAPDQRTLIPLLIKSVQELSAKVEAQQLEIDALKSTN